MNNIVVVVLIVSYIMCPSEAKNFTRCELAMELLKQNFSDQLQDWVCLVEAESSRRTDAIGGPDDDGSYDYGLFQINDRYWCNSADRPGKGCHLRCQDLLSDNIAVASLCAKKIFSRQGFTAWVGWKNECYNKTLPDISNCTNR